MKHAIVRPTMSRGRLAAWLSLPLLALCGLLFSFWRDDPPEVKDPPDGIVDAKSEAVIKQFCADCHAFPPPADFARKDWPREVERGYNFYEASMRTDLEVPPIENTVAYFLKHAPDALPVYESQFGAIQDGRLAFEEQPLSPRTDGQEQAPAVAHVKYCRLDSGAKGALTCDMDSGEIVWFPVSAEGKPSHRVVCQLKNPCHVEPTDLDGDGRQDFVVADLGSFLPGDHRLGSVWWLRVDETGTVWEPQVLVKGLGRVCDVQPADFDRDGDLDLVVAEFGWLETGRVLLLENQGIRDGVPNFRTTVLDDRHGTIHVPVVDFNSDGWPDFVALISQEHETVEVFLNKQGAGFESHQIYAANDPSFGSSGIELVDLDGDGDLDVIYTNGDSFDSQMAKPYHGIRWLENEGSFPFREHRIAQIPGVHRALAGDLDQDGDLDIVAVTFLPVWVLDDAERYDGIVWLEQVSQGEFVGHAISKGSCEHVTCDLADWDDDGRLDLLVGHFPSSRLAGPPLLTWLRNRQR